MPIASKQNVLQIHLKSGGHFNVRFFGFSATYSLLFAAHNKCLVSLLRSNQYGVHKVMIQSQHYCKGKRVGRVKTSHLHRRSPYPGSGFRLPPARTTFLHDLQEHQGNHLHFTVLRSTSLEPVVFIPDMNSRLAYLDARALEPSRARTTFWLNTSKSAVRSDILDAINAA